MINKKARIIIPPSNDRLITGLNGMRIKCKFCNTIVYLDKFNIDKDMCNECSTNLGDDNV